MGSEIDPELAEIAVAIESKYDSSDIASQAQAEAGVSNSVLMTPLRVRQYLSGGGTADVIPDLLALDDPGDDRILFWDESGDEVTFLDIGTHLEITAGNVLNVTEASIDHDALTNFVADEHIDHTTVDLTAGEGLTGGGTIATSRTFALDVDGLTTENTLDNSNDQIMFYDASATAHRKVAITALIGDELGDGRFGRTGSTQATGAGSATTVIFNTARSDNLERGTFSTSTGEYTASGTARVFVHAQVSIATLDAATDGVLTIQLDGVTVATGRATTEGGVGPLAVVLQASAVVSMTASQVIRAQVTTTNAESISIGNGVTEISFVELG